MATNITAITNSSDVEGTNNARQFRDVVQAVIPFKAVLDDDTLAAQVAGQADITVAGAALGDFVLLVPGVDNAAQIVYAQVTAANTVTITTFNVEGTDADTSFAASPTFYGMVLKRNQGIWDSL